MQTVEQLRRKIHTAEALLGVVKTMRTLAAVNMRHYELAVAALAEYEHTVEMGLHIVLTEQNGEVVSHMPDARRTLGAIIFGSDQGLCGQFNDRVVDFAVAQLRGLTDAGSKRLIMAVGARCAALLDDIKQPVDSLLGTPGGIGGVGELVQALVAGIEKWRMQAGVDRILLFYNRPLGGIAYQPQQIQLWPVDLDWLRELEQRRWPGRCLPTYTMDRTALFAALIRQHLYVALFRACVESLAAENISRVASMQSAEHNIQERLDELTLRYYRQRQELITAELLDVVTGFEAVTGAL